MGNTQRCSLINVSLIIGQDRRIPLRVPLDKGGRGVQSLEYMRAGKPRPIRGHGLTISSSQDEGGKLRVWTTRNVDTYGELEDSSGAIIAKNDDDGRGDNFRIIRNVEPGTYFLKVSPFRGYVGKKYTVRARFPKIFFQDSPQAP